MDFDLLFPVVVGFLGSLHCLGMCGPLVSTLSVLESRQAAADTNRTSMTALSNAIALHAGRLLSYGLAGALAALLFRAGDLSRALFNLRSPAMLLAGTIMLVSGLHLAGVLPLPGRLSANSVTRLSSRLATRLVARPTPGARLLLGGAFVLIPCCLTWAMVVTAAATLDPLDGFLSMVAFGIGSAPALVLAGTLPWILPARIRLLGERVAALAVAAVGVLTVLKGVGLVD